MKIPLSNLSEDALRGIIEAFVLREGTDYGHREHDFRAKCLAVRRQLQSGLAEIVFDPVTETADIRLAAETGGGDRMEKAGSRNRANDRRDTQ